MQGRYYDAYAPRSSSPYPTAPEPRRYESRSPPQYARRSFREAEEREAAALLRCSSPRSPRAAATLRGEFCALREDLAASLSGLSAEIRAVREERVREARRAGEAEAEAEGKRRAAERSAETDERVGRVERRVHSLEGIMRLDGDGREAAVARLEQRLSHAEEMIGSNQDAALALERNAELVERAEAKRAAELAAAVRALTGRVEAQQKEMERLRDEAARARADAAAAREEAARAAAGARAASDEGKKLARGLSTVRKAVAATASASRRQQEAAGGGGGGGTTGGTAGGGGGTERVRILDEEMRALKSRFTEILQLWNDSREVQSRAGSEAFSRTASPRGGRPPAVRMHGVSPARQRQGRVFSFAAAGTPPLSPHSNISAEIFAPVSPRHAQQQQ